MGNSSMVFIVLIFGGLVIWLFCDLVDSNDTNLITLQPQNLKTSTTNLPTFNCMSLHVEVHAYLDDGQSAQGEA